MSRQSPQETERCKRIGALVSCLGAPATGDKSPVTSAGPKETAYGDYFPSIEREHLAAAYYELLMAVARKFPGETRHQTALRYIRETEQRANDPSPSMLSREA